MLPLTTQVTLYHTSAKVLIADTTSAFKQLIILRALNSTIEKQIDKSKRISKSKKRTQLKISRRKKRLGSGKGSEKREKMRQNFRVRQDLQRIQSLFKRLPFQEQIQELLSSLIHSSSESMRKVEEKRLAWF